MRKFLSVNIRVPSWLKNKGRLNKLEPQFGLKRPDQVKEAPNQGERVPSRPVPQQTLSRPDLWSRPEVDISLWTFRVFGVVDREITLNWKQFKELDWVTLTADFHCVTQWSALDQTWEGVRAATALELAGVRPQAK